MDWLLVLFYLVSLLPALLYLVLKHKFAYWEKRGVPHEPPRIPYGDLDGIGTKEDMQQRVAKLYKKYKDRSLFFGMYYGTVPFAVVTDLDLINSILIKDFNHFADRGLFHNEKVDPLSGHLFFLEGQRWRQLRTKLSPTFTSGRMKYMFPTVLEVAEKFREALSDQVDQDPIVEVKDVCARFTTDVIGTIAYGINCNSISDENGEFRRNGRRIFEDPRGTIRGRLLKIAYRNLCRFFKLKVFDPDISEFFINVVHDNVRSREENNIRRKDFMDLLIQLKNHGKLDADHESYVGKLEFGELAAQAFVFFIAGFETSSSTMSYALFELAKNPEIQNKLRTEIRDILKKHNNVLNYDSLFEMKYLEQVVSETLRKYPTLPILHRNTMEDYTISTTGQVIEKGVRVLIPVHAIHHDPAIYPKPELFDPDRFSQEEAGSREKAAYLPFGEGPRHCIGMRFGKMQVSIGLITLLCKFKFDVTPKTPNQLALKLLYFVPQVQGGICLKLTKI